MANTNCDCHIPQDPAAKTTLGIMARSASQVIAGPVSKGTARALLQYCSTHNCGQSEALRKALTFLSSNDDPDAVLKTLRELLGLDATASQGEVTDAITALFAEVGEVADPNADPTGEGADVPPQTKPQGTGAASLSADQKATAARIADPKKKARYIEMCVKSPLRAPLAKPTLKPLSELSADQKATAARMIDPVKRARFLAMCAKSPF